MGTTKPDAAGPPGLGHDLAELAGLCHAAGRPDWAPGQGGCGSLKSAGGLLLMKAAGLRMDEAGSGRGWVALDLAAVRDCRDQDGPGPTETQAAALLRKAQRPLPGAEAQGLRPPAEAELHALGPRVCLQLNMVEAAAALCLEDAQEELGAALRPLRLELAWADYRPPGHGLARLLRDGLGQRQAQLAGLANQGLVAWGEQTAQVLALMRRVQQALAAHFKAVEPPHLRARDGERQAAMHRAANAVKAAFPGLKHTAPARDPWAQSLAAGGVWSWQPICPDDVLGCGAQVPETRASQEPPPERLLAAWGRRPGVAVLSVRDHGVLIAAADERAWRGAHELLGANARARALARTRNHVRPLDPAQVAELAGRDEAMHSKPGGRTDHA
jgi:hypothetical protein